MWLRASAARLYTADAQLLRSSDTHHSGSAALQWDAERTHAGSQASLLLKVTPSRDNKDFVLEQMLKLGAFYDWEVIISCASCDLLLVVIGRV